MWYGRILRTQNCGTRYKCLAVPIAEGFGEGRAEGWGAMSLREGAVVVVEWSSIDEP